METATADVTAAAEELAPALAAGLRDGGRPAEELRVLAQFARSAPGPDVAEALVELAAGHDDPSVRAFASWALIPSAELEGSGAAVPTLLRRITLHKHAIREMASKSERLGKAGWTRSGQWFYADIHVAA